jgi:polyadenylate-binding protein
VRSNSGPVPVPVAAAPSEMTVTAAQLTAASSIEQKQMLGEVLYMRIAP